MMVTVSTLHFMPGEYVPPQSLVATVSTFHFMPGEYVPPQSLVLLFQHSPSYLVNVQGNTPASCYLLL